MNTVAAGSTVTITKVLPLGVVTAYTTGAVSINVTFKGVTTRYNATVTNSTLIAPGSITASIVFPTVGMYQVKVVSESQVDLDTDGVTSTQVASGSVVAYTALTVVTL